MCGHTQCVVVWIRVVNTYPLFLMTARAGDLHLDISLHAGPVSRIQRVIFRPKQMDNLYFKIYSTKGGKKEYIEQKLKWKMSSTHFELQTITPWKCLPLTDSRLPAWGRGGAHPLSSLHDKWYAAPGIQLGDCFLSSNIPTDEHKTQLVISA